MCRWVKMSEIREKVWDMEYKTNWLVKELRCKKKKKVQRCEVMWTREWSKSGLDVWKCIEWGFTTPLRLSHFASNLILWPHFFIFTLGSLLRYLYIAIKSPLKGLFSKENKFSKMCDFTFTTYIKSVFKSTFLLCSTGKLNQQVSLNCRYHGNDLT